MRSALAIALVAGALGGCGGKDGTLSLAMVVSPVDDPFTDATQVKFTIGNAAHVKTFPVTGGHFAASIELAPLSTPGAVLVDALDATGNVVGHGQTPVLSLAAISQGPIAVWIGRPGRIAPANAALAKPRSEVAAVAIPGLGILYSGGREADGTAVTTTAVYSVFTHDRIDTSPMSQARAGAAGAAIGQQAAIFGGATAAGLGSTGMPVGTTELFDPAVGLGLWSAVPSDALDARSRANVITLTSGVVLFSGGTGGAGQALDSAALFNPTGSLRVTKIAAAMAAARSGHAVAPAKFADGDGALLFGGLPDGSNGPVVERLLGQTFSALDLGALDNRIGATATTLADGTVVIAGGTIAGVVVASGVRINPTLATPTATPLDAMLSVPRVGHTATRVGADVLVCGGADDKGVPAASCDLLDGTTLGLKKTLTLGTARRDHTAAVLETGPIVIAGGVGADGAPLASLEIYTPQQ